MYKCEDCGKSFKRIDNLEGKEWRDLSNMVSVDGGKGSLKWFFLPEYLGAKSDQIIAT